MLCPLKNKKFHFLIGKQYTTGFPEQQLKRKDKILWCLKKLAWKASNDDRFLWQRYTIFCRSKRISAVKLVVIFVYITGLEIACEPGTSVMGWRMMCQVDPEGQSATDIPPQKRKAACSLIRQRASPASQEIHEGPVSTSCFMSTRRWKVKMVERSHKYPGHLQPHVVGTTHK